MAYAPKKWIYVQVIESEGIVQDGAMEPFVEIKYNGSSHLHKKSTRYRQGVEWWDKTFRFKVKDSDRDWVAVEIRDKGAHTISSDWIGEVQIKIAPFVDGEVHEEWYKLERGNWKSNTQKARGHIHLAFQMMTNQFDRPFADQPFQKTSFQDWRNSSGMLSPGVKQWEPTSTHKEEEDPNKLYNFFELTYPTIEEAERTIMKNASRILREEHFTQEQIAEFKKLNRVNCLHRGKFEECRGKIYMVGVDGSESAKAAFDNILQLMNDDDHVFFVCVRERVVPAEYNERASIILRHEIWRAAAGIVSQFQIRLNEKFPKVEYTSVLPEADDAREILCALVKRYKVDVLVVGKHKPGEMQSNKSRYFRSFSRYCQGHARCSVMTFGATGTQPVEPIENK
uniref:Predicted protein n=1 Tax=Hordeum vulgare subsp. vulgare TaxID=112509 RepID=F2E3E8_HORVV|nr:predicted protein [Hordeum vulgare subsp. vulgare]